MTEVDISDLWIKRHQNILIITSCLFRPDYHITSDSGLKINYLNFNGYLP
jgi:hypothetical protein